jgi:YihY family inner membrane protein
VTGITVGVKKLIARVDRFQRTHGWAGVPVAVAKKFGEDKAGQLAALVAYYAFFSLFPLMLALVTIVGLVFEGDAGLQERVIGSALAQFPVLGDRIRQNIGELGGSFVALAVGLAGALWAGLGGIKGAQNAMDQIWDVPIKRQPNFLLALVRAILMLATLGMFVALSTFLGGVAAGTEQASPILQAVGIAGSFALNFLVFLVGFKVLTVANVRWRDILPGALVASVLWSALQALGGYIIGHRLESASETYGFFAVVIGLLTWLYLGSQITLLAAEVNVVRTKRLWPRSLDPEDLTEADRRTLRELAEVEERREDQRVDVSFRDDPADAPIGRRR